VAEGSQQQDNAAALRLLPSLSTSEERSSRQQQREQQRERMQQAGAVWSWQVAHALASSASTKALQQVSISVAMSTSAADTIICSLPELQELHVGIGIP
jgi:hypothetical protein